MEQRYPHGPASRVGLLCIERFPSGILPNHLHTGSGAFQRLRDYHRGLIIQFVFDVVSPRNLVLDSQLP